MIIKNVKIIEKSTGILLVEYPISELAELPSEEYRNEAWDLAMEEGLVNALKRDDYDIEVIVDIAPVNGKLYD
ncbi:hypothetical protein [Nitrosomonas oligotropha]|uniref:hypothetical protein n=1 Tax=Nitrosomonas oligotropha TaxID=42354 RepID=UPI00137099D6|nr:hypothetical protein [Nitrosomonas oligotropha]MXS84311.1 hypothetical protein [Nitrosomonas oligotropha]